MSKIIAIGGSQDDMKDIKSICSDIFEEIKTNKPKLLYIPTANKDHEWYSNHIKEYFENNFNCIVDVLYLITQTPSQQEINERIMLSDCVFVEGGDLKFLLETWAQYGVGEYLYTAYKKGIVISGISAGAVCWFDYAYSDGASRTSNDVNYSVVKGLGFVPGIISPHFENVERKDNFLKEFENNEEFKKGWGIETQSAIIIEDDEVRVINNGYKFVKIDDKRGITDV